MVEVSSADLVGLAARLAAGIGVSSLTFDLGWRVLLAFPPRRCHSAFAQSAHSQNERPAMAEPQIRFDDGAGYERMMGKWSRLAGEVFLDWLKPPPGLRWIDVGCGNGAFTELLTERAVPTEIQGVDPSDAQLSFARSRHHARVAQFQSGDATALPFADDRFDAAAMALVIFFVPEPAKGVAEMARVVRPGGTIAAYVWDMLGGGYPGEAIQAEMREMGLTHLRPPSFLASRMDNLRELWASEGLDAVETREITVQRIFADLDDFWATTSTAASIGPIVAGMPSAEAARL